MFSLNCKLALALAVLLMTSAAGTAQQPQSNDYAITSRQIPPEYKTTAELLDYLKPAAR